MSLRPELKEKIAELQKRVDERGIRNMKFSLNPTGSRDINDIAEDAIQMIEAFLDGKVTPIGPIGDLPK